MKKLLVLLFALLSAQAFGQAFSGTVLQNSPGNYGRPVPYPQILVCAPSDTSVPCVNRAITYQDDSLTGQCSQTGTSGLQVGNPTTGPNCNNPGIGDVNGNYTIHVTPGEYMLCTYSGTWLCQEVTMGVGSSDVNPAAQGRTAYYSAPGSGNTIAGDTCTTDGLGHVTCSTIGTNTAGTGTVTMANGAAPANPPSGNSTLYTDASGNLKCVTSGGGSCLTNGSATAGGSNTQVQFNSSGSFGGISNVAAGSVLASAGSSTTPSFQTKPYIDVRDAGIDCTGVSDSTSALQAMINAAPDFSKFVFPENCKVLVSTTSGSPTAITIQSRYGLEFYFEGRNTNSCDTGGTGPGGAAIIDSSSYVSGAKIFYINQSQRLLFHNVVLRLNGAVDIGFDVDQSTSPPITTQNIWENTCVQNSSSANSAFRGWRFSNVSASNVESQWLTAPYVLCSTAAPTSATSNGYGISFSSSANQKNEIVDKLVTKNCSSDVYAAGGSDFTMRNWMMSNSYTNFSDGLNNSLVSGMRSEGSTHSIAVLNAIGPHFYMHNDFAAINGLPIDCSASGSGCGFQFLLGNNADNATLTYNWGVSLQGQNTSIFAAGNRNMGVSQYDAQLGEFVIPATAFPIVDTFGEYFTSPSKASATLTNNQSGPIILEGISSGSNTPFAHVLQEVPNGSYGAISNSTVVIAPITAGAAAGVANVPTGVTGWLAFPGNVTGWNIAQVGTPVAPGLAAIGTSGSTCYSYTVVAHGNNGVTVASSASQICTGNAVLSSSNFIKIGVVSDAGAVSYDIYRTQCAGNGICLTNATGLIGSLSAGIFLNQLTSAASQITLYDTGLAGDGTTSPTKNTTGTFTATNCAATGTSANPSVASCSGAISGSVACATAASTGTCTVSTTTVTANSEIFVTQRTDTTTGTRLSVTCNTNVSSTLPAITAVSANTSFTFQLGTFNTNPECFSYFIVN